MTTIADLPRDTFVEFAALLKAVPPEARHDVLADLRRIATERSFDSVPASFPH